MTTIVNKFLPVLFALVLVLSLSLATAVPAAAQGDTWYVNATTGNDSYNGTAPNDAFQTIEHAVTTANATDTILVAAGTYTENVEVNKQLTLTGDLSQPSNVVVNASKLDKNVITLTVDECVLRGFKVQGGKFGINLESNNNTLTGNIVTDNDIGVNIQASVDASTISMNFNNIYGNTSYGIDNASTTPVNAENNWWGANDGPSPSPGSGDAVYGDVDYDPWIVLGVSANPTSIVADGSSTSTITCDMTINSAGQDTSGLGHIPDGTQIIFTTDKGSIGSLEVTKQTVNGKATAILTSSTTSGTATVTAKAPPYTTVAQDSTTVDFTLAPLDHFTFANISSPQTAGVSFSITITAKDQYGNTLTSYTGTNTLSDTTNTIAPNSTGNFTNSVWTGNAAITKAQTGVTITTTGAGKSGTSNSFDISAGSLDHIVISPNTANVTTGDNQTYTAEAFDQYNNSLSDVTNDTTFETMAGAGGSWAANTYTSGNSGAWTVTGSYSGKSDTATLAVATAGSLPPAVSIASPRDGYSTTGRTVTVEGTVVATPTLNEATLTVNGASKTITVSDGAFSKTITLYEGKNTITVSASNLAGTDSDSITIIHGGEPEVDITSPTDGAIFQTTPITVEGTVDAMPEVTEATLTLNGNASTITVTDGEFSEAVDLVDGENTIVVSATNVAGTDTSPTIAMTLNKEAATPPPPPPPPPSPPPPPPPPPPPSSTTNWWLIGSIFGGMALIAIVVFRMLLRSY